MFWYLFSKGLIVGFAIAAVVGPIGVLCVRRSLVEGMVAGLAVGLGAALADALYGTLVALGVTALSDFFIHNAFWCSIFGGSFLLYLGFNTYRSQVVAKGPKIKAKGLAKVVVSSFVLTVTNPMTVIAFLAIFTSFGFSASTKNNFDALCLVAGVFIGSCFWWLLLAASSSVFRSKLSVQILQRINKLSGAIIIIFGIAALFKALFI